MWEILPLQCDELCYKLYWALCLILWNISRKLAHEAIFFNLMEKLPWRRRLHRRDRRCFHVQIQIEQIVQKYFWHLYPLIFKEKWKVLTMVWISEEAIFFLRFKAKVSLSFRSVLISFSSSMNSLIIGNQWKSFFVGIPTILLFHWKFNMYIPVRFCVVKGQFIVKLSNSFAVCHFFELKFQWKLGEISYLMRSTTY